MSSADAAQAKTVGNYELLHLIAEGGMGAVWRARNLADDSVVAVKIIPTETARNPLLLRRFEQEFKAASLIDHPHVVKALDYCGTGPTPFLVMEFVDGESLGQRVERLGSLPEAEAIRLIGQVCEGLHRAHKQGLIHRDVKPDNVLVTWEGVAKLTDLGLVKGVEAEMNLTRTGRGLGTPHYMAPEQFRNAKNADVRCDVYSLGATLYTLVTGAVPFDKLTPLDCWMRKSQGQFLAPKALNPALSDRLDWAVRRAMGADAKSRPASCREFMEDLTGAVWRGNRGSGGGFLAAGGRGTNTPLPPPPTSDLWYLVYRDSAGHPRTVKGTTDGVRKNVAARTLGDSRHVHVSRTKVGPFLPLRDAPEFRDLVVPAGGVQPEPSRLIETVFAVIESVVPTPRPGPVSTVAEPDPTVAYDPREVAPSQMVDLEPAPFAPADEPARDWTPWVVLTALAASLAAAAYWLTR